MGTAPAAKPLSFSCLTTRQRAILEGTALTEAAAPLVAARTMKEATVDVCSSGLVMDTCPPDVRTEAAGDVVTKMPSVVGVSGVMEVMSRATLSQGAGR